MTFSWWKAFWAASIAVLVGLAFWRNRSLYSKRSRTFAFVKSLIDVGLVVTLAFRLPILLCGYVILWLTRPFQKQPIMRVTMGVLIGALVATLSGVAIEFIVIAGIFAIDAVTGGVWKYWHGIGTQKINWKQEIFGKRFARAA